MNTNNNATELSARDILTILERVIREIILHPNDLKIESDSMTRTLTIHVQAHRGDTSRIIGTGGAHFHALRAMLAAMGHKAGIVVKLPKIREPEHGEQDSYPPLRESGDWPRDKVIDLMRDVCRAVFKNADALSLEAVDGKGGVTTIELVCDEAERDMAEAMGPHLMKLFVAIGNAHGRQIEFTIFPALQSEAQPTTAAGRHAGELSR
jgi:predicted RNA-binding protein YlqC (UPF0109 family)